MFGRLAARALRAGGVVAGLLCGVVPAAAQTNMQLWGNATFDWKRTDRRTYALDFEPKVLVAAPDGEPSWRSLDVTPSATFVVRDWVDAVAELNSAFTHQTDGLNSIELAPRIGAHFHLFSRDLPAPLTPLRPRRDERPPKRRLVIRDLLRVEFRNLFYFDDDTPNSCTVRLRNRLEFLSPLNRDRLTDDGARYLIADWEWFVPLDEPSERFANKQRVRAGLGYRHDASWKLECLYIWSRSRNTTSENFKTSDNIIDIVFKTSF